MLILITKDLFFVPLFKGAAAKVDCDVKLMMTCTESKLEELNADAVVACVVDLSSQSVAGIPELGASLKGHFPNAVRCAFGPHVQVARLEAAKSSGFDPVLSRGQVDNQVDALLESWIARKTT